MRAVSLPVSGNAGRDFYHRDTGQRDLGWQRPLHLWQLLSSAAALVADCPASDLAAFLPSLAAPDPNLEAKLVAKE